MKLNIIIAIILPLITGCISVNSNISLDDGLNNVDYDIIFSKFGIKNCAEVRAYSINSAEKIPSPDKLGLINGKINPNRIPKNGIKLNNNQIKILIDAISKESAEKVFIFMIMKPGYTFVFYDHYKAILGHYTVCFDSLKEEHSIGDFAIFPDYKALWNLVNDLKLPKPASCKKPGFQNKWKKIPQ